jgi:hypothetical protein
MLVDAFEASGIGLIVADDKARLAHESLDEGIGEARDLLPPRQAETACARRGVGAAE